MEPLAHLRYPTLGYSNPASTRSVPHLRRSLCGQPPQRLLRRADLAKSSSGKCPGYCCCGDGSPWWLALREFIRMTKINAIIVHVNFLVPVIAKKESLTIIRIFSNCCIFRGGFFASKSNF